MTDTAPTGARPWARWTSHPILRRALLRLPPGTILLSLLTFGSYAVGLLRDRALARTFGAGSDLDVYNAALVLPELCLDVLVFAGLSAAFVPVLLRTEHADEVAGRAFTRTVLTVSFLVMAVAVGVLALIAPWTATIVAPGFDEAEVRQYTVLFRQMCLTALIFAVSLALGELLVARQRFLAYGLAPLLYNLGIAAGAWVLGPRMGIEGVALGTLVGAVLHLGVRAMGVLRTGFRYRPAVALGTPAFREYLRLSVPRALAQPIEALTFLYFTAVASGMAAGSVSSVSFARNFQSVPVSLIGVAISVTAFPVLSHAVAIGDVDRFRTLARTNLLTVAALGLVAGLGLAVVAEAAIRLLLGSGRFDERDIALTAGLLVAFAMSVPLEASTHVLGRAVFATHETMLPVIASVTGLMTIVLVTEVLRGSQGLLAVPVGFAAGMAVKVAILLLALRHRIRRLEVPTGA